MRRFKPSLQSVRPAIVAYATLALAAFLPARNARKVMANLATSTEGSGHAALRFRDPWKVRGVIALPLVMLFAAGATAFAAGAGTPTGDGPVVEAKAAVTVPATASATTEAPTSTIAQAAPAKAVTPPTTAAPTTTAPPPPPTTAAPAPAPAPVVPTQVSGACGGSLPPCCVMMRESGGNPTIVNRSSGASGKWQFMTSTWAGYGGYPTAAAAPEWVQDERAAQLWAGGAGAGHWGGGC